MIVDASLIKKNKGQRSKGFLVFVVTRAEWSMLIRLLQIINFHTSKVLIKILGIFAQYNNLVQML